MATIGRLPARRLGRLGVVAAVGTAVILGTSAVNAALVSGSLPTAGLTYTSVTRNAVNMAGDPIRLKIKDNVTVKTTYSVITPADQILGGWHFHHGPVIVTVTSGTLTFFGSNCETWDVSAGETYIESAGQVLNAKALTSKNPGGSLQWFTTRLYPEDTIDPEPVDAPCTLP